MAKEYVTLEPKNEFGDVKLNKSVFSSIALNVISEDENVKLVDDSKPFKSGIITKVEENAMVITIRVKVNHKANVTDVCANLQDKIFESISYMTGYKPDSIEIVVVGFIF